MDDQMMTTRRLAWLASAAALTALPTQMLAQNLVGLGVLPGGSYSKAYAVSGDGSVVVTVR
jgi:uncharacterized membrane protein